MSWDGHGGKSQKLSPLPRGEGKDPIPWNLLLNSPPAANTLGQGTVEWDPPWMVFSICGVNLSALQERI